VILKPLYSMHTVVSRRCFFSVAPDRSYVTGTMMVELGDLRGFGGGRC